MSDLKEKNENEDDIDLAALVTSGITRVLRHKFLAISIFILILGAAFALALTSRPFYEATTKIIYQSASKSGGQLSMLASLAGISTGSGDDPSAYLPDIVFSKKVISTILDRKWQLTPKDSVVYGEPDSATLEELWKVKVDSTVKNWEIKKRYGLLGRLSNPKSKYISFVQDKKTSVITISTEFEDPQVTYDVNVFLLEELNNTLVNKMNFKASENRKFIEERLAEVKDALKAAEDVLKRYRQRNRLREDPADQLEDDRLQREVLINQEVMIQLQKQYEMAKIEEARDLPVLDVIDPPLLPVDKSRPKRKMIVMAGGVAAVFFAILFAVSIDLWQEKRNEILDFLKNTKNKL